MRKAVLASFLFHGSCALVLFLVMLWLSRIQNKKDSSPGRANNAITGIALNEVSQPSASKNAVLATHPENHIAVMGEKSASVEKNGANQSPSENEANTIENSYILELERRIMAQENYPIEAQRRRLEEVITVEFELDEKGQMIDMHVISAEKPKILVEAAVAAVRGAAPFPAPPAGISKKFQIPIEFRLSNVKKDLL
jgi:TonB family protein